MPDTQNTDFIERLPPAAFLHTSALLSGFATAFAGPALPTLSAALHLGDRGAGALLAAQFTGAFVGGWTTRSPLLPCILRGYAAATAGFALLAATLGLTAHVHLSSIVWTYAAMALLGFGTGQIITCNNLLAALRWSQHRGAALTLLNFTWSAGALSAPLFLPWLLHHFSAAGVFATFAALLAINPLLTLVRSRQPKSASLSNTHTLAGEEVDLPAEGVVQSTEATTNTGLPRASYMYFSLLLFLYGGVETSLSGWLTTFDLRYGTSLHAIAASTAAFWFCLTATRAISSALLLRLPEKPFLRGSLVLAVLALTALLLFAHTGALPLLAGLCGAALSPWFPLVFSGLVAQGPTATQAGRIIAVSGLGAAALPALVGWLSSQAGSLRIGLLLPILATVALLLLSLRSAASQASDSAQPRPAKSV